MKPFTLILIVLNILSIHCHNLRNLKLAISPEKLETLTDAATKTFKQIFQKGESSKSCPRAALSAIVR